jgi:hypothetical protein
LMVGSKVRLLQRQNYFFSGHRFCLLALISLVGFIVSLLCFVDFYTQST